MKESKGGIIEREYELIKKELKLLSGFGYPKLAGLIIVITISYFIFSNPIVVEYIQSFNNWGYLGAVVGGLFFTFGFTTPFAIGFFIALNPENIWLAAIIGGFGAMVGDLFIFKIIKFSFMDEFQRLEKTKTMKKISKLIEDTLGHKIKVYLIYY